MGSRSERRRRQRGITLITVSLAMLLATVPALAAQAPAASNIVSGDQNTSPPGPPGGSIACDHAPGEFLVGYGSEEAMNAAPQANVVDTVESVLVQYVVYDEIKNEPDPEIQRAVEEAKRQELAARSGVDYVEYNCQVGAEARAAPPLADCGECGVNIGRQAAQIIGGSEGADGKSAYDIVLEAARSADEDNVALASENEEESAGGEDMVVADTEEEATSEAEEASTGEEASAGREEMVESGKENTATGNSSDDTRVRTVNDTVASGESRVNSPLLALGGGALLVAGVFVARKIFGE